MVLYSLKPAILYIKAIFGDKCDAADIQKYIVTVCRLSCFSVCLLAVHLTVSADVTSLKSRLHFQENGQSVYSGYLSLPKKHCQPLRVGLLVRH